jgi:hypothetical protein
LRWPPSPMSRPSFPPTDPRSGTAFPPRGPLGEFPRFAGTTRCSDSLPPFRPHFVAFAWPYRAWARCSLPGEGSPPAWLWGLVTRLPDRGSWRGDDRASQVPGHPPCAHAPLLDPGSRGLRAPCVRFAAPVARTPRNTRFRLVASLCRAGLTTRRDAAEGFRVHGPCISSPLSRLRLAQHNI